MDKTMVSQSRGFTMIEVLIALAITSFVGTVIIQLMKDSANATALSEAKFDELELARQLQMTLTYKPSCEKNLQGKLIDTLTVANVEELVDSAGKSVIKKGDVVGNRSLKIDNLEFSITQDALDAFNTYKATWPTGATSYLLDVQFKLQMEKLKTHLGGKDLARTIPVKVKVDSASMIQECFATSDLANQSTMTSFCAQLGGTYDEAAGTCKFTESCDSTNPSHLIPARCVDEKLQAQMKELNKAIADLAQRVPATASTPTPTPADPYALPFSYSNPGPGCSGTGCWASDFGPCKGTNCRTNGGTCEGINCEAGATTGTVAWDGKNQFTPSNPGPGCSGTGCHAADYGPCSGTNCTTNGGSCKGISCRTGVN